MKQSAAGRNLYLGPTSPSSPLSDTDTGAALGPISQTTDHCGGQHQGDNRGSNRAYPCCSTGEVWDLRARLAHRIMFANCQWADPTDAEGWMTVRTDPGYRSPRDSCLVRSLVVATRFEFLAERYSLVGSGVADQAVAPIALRAG